MTAWWYVFQVQQKNPLVLPVVFWNFIHRVHRPVHRGLYLRHNISQNILEYSTFIHYLMRTALTNLETENVAFFKSHLINPKFWINYWAFYSWHKRLFWKCQWVWRLRMKRSIRIEIPWPTRLSPLLFLTHFDIICNQSLNRCTRDNMEFIC